MKRIFAFSLILLGFFAFAQAQQNFPVNGLKNDKRIIYALTNAKIYIDYKTVVEKATLLINEDKIIDVGIAVSIPKEALVIDMQGKYIYPSFIDIYSDYAIPQAEKAKFKEGPQYESAIKGAYGWNEAIKADYNAFSNFVIDIKSAEMLRKAGFGAVLSLRKDGICRGTATMISLRDENHNKAIIKDKAATAYSFKKGSSQQQYPSSLMGSIALIRQTYYDAKWYSTVKNKEKNISLESWNEIQKIPQIFESDDKLNTLRIANIGEEFGVNYLIKAGGNEYQRMDDIKALKSKFILPLNFPEALDLTDPYDAMNVSLTTLKEWEMAPQNPMFFEKAGIDFAFTADGLKDKSSLLKQIQKAIKNGLSEQQALKALTQTPAEFMLVSDILGALKKGMLANFIISSGNIFEKENVIFENWVQGQRYIHKNFNEIDIRGKYAFKIGSEAYFMRIGGSTDIPKIDVLKDTTKLKTTAKFAKNDLSLSFETGKKENTETYKLNALFTNKKFTGNLQMPDGSWQSFNADFVEAFIEIAKKDSSKTEIETGPVIYPFCAYGSAEQAKQEEVILKNATVWTNEKEGILSEADVWIKAGKIAKVGKDLQSPTAKIIDAKGKHVTAGIIDEHSHIAATGNVNEGAHSSSSEVRIGDVIDCEDINIYRQVAGGVTTSHILHGSANAIGGQTQVIKLRWGKNPSQMKFEGADGFIKFALGENVKQTNWGEKFTIRYPQTRMGVEQIYIDAFTRAKEYEASLKDPLKQPVRKDLQLDAMLEILNKKRFITCHSYQQSEINMLMHVADSFNFKINTFTHILEGYKVADKMKKHGVGASSFADWWGYKYEVIEAIPYNGAILNQMEVLTAFNSDDAEMARRLNQEGAKAVKYGGVSEEDALKFVTLNPAKLLHIDHKVGSLKEGKDADIVLWNDHPLSVYAKPLQTYIDGICYFDTDRDLQLRKEIGLERNRLILKMQKEKESGEVLKKPVIKKKQLQHCNEYELLPHENETN